MSDIAYGLNSNGGGGCDFTCHALEIASHFAAWIRHDESPHKLTCEDPKKADGEDMYSEHIHEDLEPAAIREIALAFNKHPCDPTSPDVG